jgi:phage terminase Nu1 subunit (DNA packaging protein)
MATANNTVPLATVAKLLDLTERRVNQLAKEGVLPKTARGRYELVPVVRAYIAYLRQKAVNSDVSRDDWQTQRTRLTKLKADMAEMEKLQMQDRLIPADDVSDAWEAMVSNMKAKMLSLPSKVATAVFVAEDAGESKRIIKEQINEALAELAAIQVKTANPIRATIIGDDSDQDPKATRPATRTKSK